MSRFFISIILLLFSISLFASDIFINKRVNESKQLLLVLTDNWSSVNGVLQRYQKNDHNSWVKIGKSFPVVVGKTGMGWSNDLKADSLKGPVKREGDNRSPAGIFSLAVVFGTNQSPHFKMPYKTVTRQTICVDDSRSIYYNQIVDLSKIAVKPGLTEEKMWQFSDYELGVMINHNVKHKDPQAGSCIFLHIQGEHEEATIGCTALAKQDLLTIVRWLDTSYRPIIVQAPKSAYGQLTRLYHLPELDGERKTR